MPSKKIVFVIVEGPSDDETLGLLLSRIYNKAEVFVYITHGDITTQAKSNSILSKIGSLIKDYAKSNHLKKKNFQEIIHIIDTDGAYIPDDAVIEDAYAENPVYSLTKISTKNVNGIRNRNAMKSGCLDKMSSTTAIWDVPYHTYYMSCNLEHVLHDIMNASNQEKENKAFCFAQKYKDDIAGFIEFISSSSFSVNGEYRETWHYIKDGLHSLERHTNLGICLKAVRLRETQSNL